MTYKKFIKGTPKQRLIQGIILAIVAILFYFLGNPGGRPKDQQLTQATYVSCMDGDTAMMKVNGEQVKVRFIAVDTPELSSNDYYAEQAKTYTCSRLDKGAKIELEFDPKADPRDKFGRMIAWVYVDGVNLQKELVEKGYAKVRYIYDDYRYVGELNALQKKAKSQKIGIWKSA